MRQLSRLVMAGFAVAAVSAARPASAQITSIPDPSAFSPSAIVVTFTHLPLFTSAVGSGVTMTHSGGPVHCTASDGPLSPPFNANDGMAAVCDNDQPFTGDAVVVQLPGLTNRIAFEARFNGYGQGVTVTFFNGPLVVGVEVGPAPADASTSPNGWTFQGWQSTTTMFDRISIQAPNNGYVRLDNLRFEAPVPPFFAHWTFDENGGTTAADSTGSGNDATLADGSAMPAWAPPAPFTPNVSSLEFDGVDDFAQVPDNATQHPTKTLTIAAWVYPTAPQPFTHGIISKPRSFPSDGTGWALRIEGGEADLGANNGVFNCSFHAVTAGALPLNVWTHIAATWDSSGPQTVVKLYVNGVLSDTYTGGCALPHSDLSTGPSILQLGREFGTPNFTRNYSGRIDDARIYNVVLSDQDIAGLVAPVARCQDVTVNGGPACSASASIDNGSFHPAGLPVSLAQTPPGPYGIGSTNVTLTASIASGAAATCSAVVTVVNSAAPVASCDPGVNPAGHAPNQNAGFVRVHGSSACTPVAISLGSYALADGENIKIDVSPDASGVTLVGTMGGGIRHFIVGPDAAQISVTDGTHTTVAACGAK